MSLFMEWLTDERGLKFKDFHELWDWSINDLEAFWKSIWDYFKLNSINFRKCFEEKMLLAIVVLKM